MVSEFWSGQENLADGQTDGRTDGQTHYSSPLRLIMGDNQNDVKFSDYDSFHLQVLSALWQK